MQTLIVEIDRAAGLVIPKQVFDFEYPVLEVIHGEENVRAVGEPVESDAELTADQAYALLNARYDKAAVKAAYQSGRNFARTTGLEGGGESGAQETQASVKVRAPAKSKKAATKKAE